MNVESTSATKVAKASTSSSSSTSTKDSSTTFKDELDAVKTQEVKTAEETKATEASNAETTQNSQKTAEENATTQLEKKETAESLEKTSISDPLKELNSKIATLNELKNGFKSPLQAVISKTDDTTDKSPYCQTIKMDNNDISFFVNLVDNQQMFAQNNLGINPNAGNRFTDIKTEATQSAVHVSATLLDAMNESVKTNKPFRIDFDGDIAVVLKVNKEGVLSANFIPGSAAVENYLRNNIAGLRQNFDNQDLPYNELSYSNQPKQEQQEKESKNNKENENE